MLQRLDHKILNLLQENSLQEKEILVALSGGADSTALLKSLSKVHKKVSACYFHHGENENTKYRHQAQEFCKNICKELNVPFHALQSSKVMKSEEEFRTERYQAIKNLMVESNIQVLSTGHHSDDLLETRLIRLIRGTGSQGLSAMEVYNGSLFRPFLKVSKKDLIHYLEKEKTSFVEDPTNQNVDPLRNWIRNSWLPSLEKRQGGASSSISRSLQILAEELSSSQNDLLIQNQTYCKVGISRSFYLTLTPIYQKRLLAQYLFSLGKRDFSQSHLEEVQKRLDSSQREFSFKSASCQWTVNALGFCIN